MEVLGNVIIIAGIILMFFGVMGIFKFKNFYPRILVTAKIDTVGTITLVMVLIVKNGLSFFSLKLLLLLGIMLMLNPLAAHMVARSAYLSGYKIEDRQTMDDDGYANKKDSV